MHLEKPRARSAKQDAIEVETAVCAALAKARNPALTLLVAVPWVSDDLTTRFDSQRLALHRLMEQSLSERPDLALVELPEAKALAAQIAVAGKENVQRRQPLMLDGALSTPR